MLREQRPAIEALPAVVEPGDDAELDVAAFEELRRFQGGSAQELDLETGKMPAQLAQMRDEWIAVDAARERHAQGCDVSARDGRSERLCAKRAFIASLQQRQHALAELRQLSLRPFPPEKVSPEFGFELPNGPRQRGLSDMAFLSRPREVARACHRQEISDLMHLHATQPVAKTLYGTIGIRLSRIQLISRSIQR